MKSKSTFQFIILLFVCGFVHAQPVITNCENFSLGTQLKFQPCNTSSVHPGTGGAGMVWDFSGLTPLATTSVEWMVSPGETSHGSLFPTANLVEKYSDGTFVYVHMNADSNFLVGYVDTVNNYTMTYPNPALFALRPISYTNNIADTFTVNFSSPSYSYTGTGQESIVADGYGTLKLPTGDYPNTLRLKITQTQNDTSSTYTFSSTTVSYVWFDGSHTSALLKIDSTKSGSTIIRSVEYLVHEATAQVTSINDAAPLSFYPNPAKHELHISPILPGSISIIDAVGKTVISQIVDATATVIPLTAPNGMYYLVYRTPVDVQTFKLLVTGE